MVDEGLVVGSAALALAWLSRVYTRSQAGAAARQAEAETPRGVAGPTVLAHDAVVG